MKKEKIKLLLGSLIFFLILSSFPVSPLFIGVIFYVTLIPVLYWGHKKIPLLLSSSDLEVEEVDRLILPKERTIYAFSSVSALFTGEGWSLLTIRWILNNNPTIFLPITYEIILLWVGLMFPTFLQFFFVFDLPLINWVLKYLIPIFLLSSLRNPFITIFFTVGIVLTASLEPVFFSIIIKSGKDKSYMR